MVLGAETALRKVLRVELTARCGAFWGPPGRRRSGTACKTTAQRHGVAPDRSLDLSDLHQATRCVALVTETRLNVIDG